MKPWLPIAVLVLALNPMQHLVAQTQPQSGISTQTPTPLPTNSIFQLDLSLETADGHPLPFTSLRGRPLLITLFYTECSSICPMTTAELQTLEQSLPPPTRDNLNIVMVSLDPTRDTPAALQRFKQAHHLNSPRWILARSSPSNVRALAAALGIRYRELPDQTINHSAVITLTDRDGVIDTQAQGWQAVDDHFRARLKAIAAGASATPQDDAQ